jgi:zinc protease
MPAAEPAVTSKPAPVDPESAPLPLWEEVKKGQLPNGLTYYVLKHGKPEKRAMLWLAVNSGSVQEDDDQRGLAHFDEHMAFNGTKRFPKGDIISYLEKIGMRFGADLNAYTSWDQTVYQLEVPTDDPQYLARGLDILHEWAGDVSYDPVEVDKERGVVLEEWRLGRGASRRLFDKHAKVLFAGSRYADRITIGDPEIIKSGKRDTLYRYYKDWYRPDQMAVIAVGDVDPAAMEKEIAARFGDLTGPAHERTRPAGGVPPAKGTRVSIETDREAPGTSITVSNLVPHRPQASKRDYRRMVGEQLYGSILNERLASLARKPETPFISASGGMSTLVREVDAFQRSAQVKNGQVEDALRALLTEVVRIERHGVTPTELERARTRIARLMSEEAETAATHDSREFTDEITRNFLSHEEMIGRTAERDLALALLPQITVAELDSLARPFAGADGRVVLISGPDGKPLPSRDRVLAIIGEVEKAEVPAWQDEAPLAPLMAKTPTPGKIVKETKVDKLDLTEWTLSNGVRVIVKPTDYEVDSVVITGNSPGGLNMAKDKDYNDARFADAVAEVGGVADFDVEMLGKMLADKQLRVSTGISDVTEVVDASGSAHDLETMLQLVYLRMTAPRKDEQAFKVWKQNSIEQLTNRLRTPEFEYSRSVQKALYKDHLRRRPAEPSDIEKVDQDRALAFYKDRFGDASDFTFVVIGSVDVAKLRPLVETYLGSLPGKGRKEKEKDLGVRKIGGVVKKEWKLGQEPKASVQLDFHGDEAWTRDKERDMFILGQVLSIRLREQLREEMGGVYGVGAAGFIARVPHQERTFSIRFGCDPTRVGELVTAAMDEIRKLAKDGPGEEYLEKIKKTFVRTRETQLRQNRFWASWLTDAYRFGDDPAIVLDVDKVTARMTAANVQASAKRYLDGKPYFEAVLLPAQAAGSAAAPSQTPAAVPGKDGGATAK